MKEFWQGSVMKVKQDKQENLVKLEKNLKKEIQENVQKLESKLKENVGGLEEIEKNGNK